MTNLHINQDGKGKISGSNGSANFYSLTTLTVKFYNIKGKVKSKKGQTSFKISFQFDALETGSVAPVAFKGMVKLDMVLDESLQAIVGTVTTKASAKGLGSDKWSDPWFLDLPPDMDGSFSFLLYNETPDGKKLYGEALLMLANGREITFQSKGKYNAKKDDNKFALKGVCLPSKGATMKLKVSGPDYNVDQLMSKMLGQKTHLRGGVIGNLQPH